MAEEVGSVVLTLRCGVIVLGLEGGSELDAGLEECAGFADGLEGAVELGWSGGRVQDADGSEGFMRELLAEAIRP